MGFKVYRGSGSIKVLDLGVRVYIGCRIFAVAGRLVRHQGSLFTIIIEQDHLGMFLKRFLQF